MNNNLLINGYNYVAHIVSHPAPAPPVEDNYLPNGRLKWTKPVTAYAWNITPASEEEVERTRHWKLHRKGWVGVCCTELSPWEEKRIAKYVRACEGKVYRFRPYRERYADGRPGDIGGYHCVTRSFCFEHEAERDGLRELVLAFPKRSIEMLVNHRSVPPELQRYLHGLNWHLTIGEDGNLFTVQEDCPATILVTAKLMLS